ncbi:hypothetical protein [Flavobacterium cerinum]|uniref:Lipoprotein n=1 Tax=Flavobacterium cerinum TaxID=2502784 RepID=A0ABY5IQW4_9FLAO|nr:hypothetical protein [Flavobacterium cerinum]UUC45190.1 hypothetical protein NOX80_16385 [Flavobacterium cerinum]
MKEKIGLIVLMLCTLCSCASFSKKIAFDNQIILKEESITKLNGTYEIESLKAIRKFESSKPDIIENDSLNRFSLFKNIKEINPQLREDIKNNSKNYKVKIDIKDKNSISFSLLKNNSKIDSITMDFKIQNDGYLYLKNKNFKTKGIPGLWGNFSVNRTRIGINSNNNLIISNSYFLYGAVLILIGDTKKTSFSSEYKREI